MTDIARHDLEEEETSYDKIGEKDVKFHLSLKKHPDVELCGEAPPNPF